ncbi:hypothetical protein JW979_07290 [bacterium]|nr:hypothetical protein [candidate division CSSED10-310 bacterium]
MKKPSVFYGLNFLVTLFLILAFNNMTQIYAQTPSEKHTMKSLELSVKDYIYFNRMFIKKYHSIPVTEEELKHFGIHPSQKPWNEIDIPDPIFSAIIKASESPFKMRKVTGHVTMDCSEVIQTAIGFLYLYCPYPESNGSISTKFTLGNQPPKGESVGVFGLDTQTTPVFEKDQCGIIYRHDTTEREVLYFSLD